MNERNPASATRADLLGQGGQVDTQKGAQARPLAQQAEAEKAAQAEARAAEERAAQEQAAAEEAAKAEKAAAEERARAEAEAAEQRAAHEKVEAEARAQAEKVAADQAAEAEKAAADEKAKAAEQRAAAKAAAKKPARPRRGPPADGGSEDRKDAILTTSKLSSTEGEKLRRGMVVSVPSRRLTHLERAGRVRIASASELEIAERRYGRALLK